MIVGTYLPFDKKKWPRKIECFEITSPESLVIGAIRQQSAYPEVLFVFESSSLAQQNIPAKCIPLQLAEAVTGDAFICDGMQDEVFPKEQDALRKHAEGYIRFASLNSSIFKGKDEYEVFLSLQKRSFEMHLLPAWSEFIWSLFSPSYEWKNRLSTEIDDEHYDLIAKAPDPAKVLKEAYKEV